MSNEIDRKLDKLFDAVEALINIPLRGRDKSRMGVREWAKATGNDGSLDSLRKQVAAALVEGSLKDFYDLLREYYRLMEELVRGVREEQVRQVAKEIDGEVTHATV